MKEKLLAALKKSTVNPQLKQQAKIAAITITWTKEGFEKEMARRRYAR